MSVDHLFDARLAALYDAFCEGRPDFPFYLPLVLEAASVLDVGCGTGALLHAAREAGHTGRLCGLDPAVGMLAQARRRTDIEWVHGDLSSVSWDREFDLVVMTGHAFQVLLEDDDIRLTLDAIRAALTDGGHFVFETRNPSARGWENWTPDRAVEIETDAGDRVRMVHRVTDISGDRVTFEVTFTSPSWAHPEVSTSTLRFLEPADLDTFLVSSGFTVTDRFGDWDRTPVTAASPEIITIAAAAR